MSRRTPQDTDSPPALAALPLILRLDDILPLLRRGRSTVLREIGQDRFRPRPFASHPYRWYRADWEEYFATRPRPKGSVAWTLKRAQALRRSARPSSATSGKVSQSRSA